jgi:hypothetical protein
MLNKTIHRLPSRFFVNALLVSASIFGTIIVIYCTRWGAALADDSFFYISSARNFLAGQGFDLVTKVPPLLTLVLSFIGLAKIDPLISIRWVNAFLFGLNIYLVGRIVYTLTKSFMFSILGALMTLVSSTLIMVHSWAMSEALFISMTLCGILIFAVGQKDISWKAPFFTGLFFGLSAATRYIGVAFLLSGGIFWLTETNKSNRHRIRNAIIFSVIGLIPLVAWMIRNEIISGKPTSRVFSIHLMPKSMWIEFLNTIFLWILPGRIVHGKELFWLGAIILLLFAWLGVALWRNKPNIVNRLQSLYEQKPIILLGLSIVFYVVILIISRSFFDERVPMDERLLSPLLVIGIILLALIVKNLWKNRRWLEYSFLIVLSLITLFTNVTRSTQMVQSYHELGRGYASYRDHISETYAYLRNRPNSPIYSNAFAAIYFWTGRVTYTLPPPSEIPAMKEDMHRTGALLVIFDSIPVELFGTTQEELIQGLVEQIRLSEATIYRSP